MLRKGDYVVMHTCIDKFKHDGNLLRCSCNEFTNKVNQNVVEIEGLKGAYSTKYLQKVNLPQIEALEEMHDQVMSEFHNYRKANFDGTNVTLNGKAMNEIVRLAKIKTKNLLK